jgi:hypothetical protein
MEEASISETSVNFYQTTRHNNPEHSHLHNRRRENLKSHIFTLFHWNIGVLIKAAENELKMADYNAGRAGHFSSLIHQVLAQLR